ncbi:MAG TPA: ferrous iron transport protein B [Candidatus Binatia bacterium]
MDTPKDIVRVPASSARRRGSDTLIVVTLAGQPNVGKSTIFNLLTGLTQRVGNWPGKTVERKEGTLNRGAVSLRIVDLPGTYSLTANSEEERIARDFILQERPDVVVMIADASALERNLYLLTELLLLPVPIVMGLNMIDVAETHGVHVEPHVLEAALGLPVVPIVATRNQGVAELIDAVERLAREPEHFQPARPEIAAPHRGIAADLRAVLDGYVPEPYDPSWATVKILEGDTEVMEKVIGWLPKPRQQAVGNLVKAHEDAVLDIASGRYEWIERMIRAAVTRPRLGQISLTDRLDKIAVHPFWGFLVLLAVFGVLFWITFSVAAPVQEWLEIAVVTRLQEWIIASLTDAPAWLVNFIAHGILGGAGIVLTFLPILVVFFSVLAFLEESGYLSRAAYVMDRFMHVLGLHGKSFLPLFLGFGCNVPALMGARTIESRSGRLLTLLLTPLVPCSARLVVLAFLTPVFFGSRALLVSLGLVGINMLALAVIGVLLNHTIFRGQHMAFIMELPLYHKPNPRTISLFVWNNVWAFLRKAGTIILIVALAVWALSNFPGNAVDQSYLAFFGRALSPVGRLMGMDWRMLVALLSSFVAKENAIATLGILYGAGAEGKNLTEILAAVVAPATGLAFLTATMLFVPCVATVAVMRQETRSWGWTLFSLALHLILVLIVATTVYQGARWLGAGV